MVDDDDLDAAVAEGILSQHQADALRTFAASRRPQQAAALPHEERFRFMRGFNDFFFAVGVVLLGSGLAFFAAKSAIANLIAAALVWALAELLVRRMRLVLPGILLACFFVFFVFQAAGASWSVVEQSTGYQPPLIRRSFTDLFEQTSTPAAFLLKLGAVALTALLFYWRFRLPFTLLLIAGSLVTAALVATGLPQLPDSPLLASLVLLLSGLLVFAAAMAYDVSDPDRVTRRADCAFWLHLLAAPLIVHSLIGMIQPAGSGRYDAIAQAAWSVVAVIGVLTVIAVIIDRRALFVSALSYLGIVIGYAITGTAVQSAGSMSIFFATLLILGVTVLLLGVGWQPLRNPVMRALPGAVTRHLPPAALKA